MQNLFWDSNVFLAFLNRENIAYDVDSIKQFLEDTKAPKNKYKIYTSIITLAEISPRKLAKSDYESFQEFLDDFEGAIEIMADDPNIMYLAGRLRDVKYKKGNEEGRILTLGDAIMLATAIELEETFGVSINYFHTFDDGKGKKGPEGAKGISLLNFQDWCEGIQNDPDVTRVRKLNRCKPDHPEKKLF